MDRLAVSCMGRLSHASGVVANPTLEILALSVVLGDTETAVENFKA
jgi:hypothetical protein